MVIVGDVNLDTLKPLVEKYIGSLPKGKKAAKWADVQPQLVKGKVVDVFDQKMETPLTSVLQVYSDYRPFTVKEQTCGVKGGYAYNWVPAKHYNIGVSEAVIPSVSKGKQSSVNPGCSFRLYNRLNLSVTWNNRRWFAGSVGKTDVAVVADKKTILANSLFSVEMKVGWRFNLW